MVAQTFLIGEVRLVAASDQACNARDVLARPCPLHLIFRIEPDRPDQSDALEVQLNRALPDDSEPGSFNLSGRVIGRIGGDSYLADVFSGRYHPGRQTGVASIAPILQDP